MTIGLTPLGSFALVRKAGAAMVARRLTPAIGISVPKRANEARADDVLSACQRLRGRVFPCATLVAAE